MLISDEYRRLNRELHESKPAFGSKGGKCWHIVKAICQEHGYKTVLDYGCGKAGLKTTLSGYGVYEYDPALDRDERRPCDLVYSRDVLEHIEPDCLSDVLNDIRANMLHRGWFLIATCKSGDILPDGRNAHLIVEDIHWWAEKLRQHGMEPVKSQFASRKQGQIEVTPI